MLVVAHIFLKGTDVQLSQLLLHVLLSDEGMTLQLIDRDSVVLVHLQTLAEEEGALGRDWLVKADLVATIIDLSDEVLHLVGVEGRLANHHFVQHHTEGPRVHFLTVASLLQQLGRTVERGSTDGQLGVGVVQNSRQTKVRDLHLEIHLIQVYARKEGLLLGTGQRLELWLVWEVQQDVGELHVTMDDAKTPHICDTLHELMDNDTSLLLFDVLTNLEQYTQIESVGILLHHVDVLACLNRLM